METIQWELRRDILRRVPTVYNPYLMQVCKEWYGFVKDEPRPNALETFGELVMDGENDLLARFMNISEDAVEDFIGIFLTYGTVDSEVDGISLIHITSEDCNNFLTLAAVGCGHVHVTRWFLQWTGLVRVSNNKLYISALKSSNPIEVVNLLHKQNRKYNFAKLLPVINEVKNLQPVVDWFESKGNFSGHYKGSDHNHIYWDSDNITYMEFIVEKGLFNILHVLEPKYIHANLLVHASADISDEDLELLINCDIDAYMAVEIVGRIQEADHMLNRVIAFFGWNVDDPIEDILTEIKEMNPKSIVRVSLIYAFEHISDFYICGRMCDKSYELLLDIGCNEGIIGNIITEQQHIRGHDGERTDEDARLADLERDRLYEEKSARKKSTRFSVNIDSCEIHCFDKYSDRLIDKIVKEIIPQIGARFTYTSHLKEGEIYVLDCLATNWVVHKYYKRSTYYSKLRSKIIIDPNRQNFLVITNIGCGYFSGNAIMTLI